MGKMCKQKRIFSIVLTVNIGTAKLIFMEKIKRNSHIISRKSNIRKYRFFPLSYKFDDKALHCYKKIEQNIFGELGINFVYK